MKILRLLLIAPFFACTALVAQYATPAAAPTPPASDKSTAPAVQADPAAADTVLKALHYDEMMSKALDQQKQMIQRMIKMAVLPGTSPEAIAAFRQKVLDAAGVGLSLDEIHAVAARNYSETFTTDELRAIADFYNSPAGQAFTEKRPQVEQKIGAALRPRVMEAMQKIQQMAHDFTAQQKAEQAAKAAAAKKASGAPVTPAIVTTPAPVPATPPKP